MTSFGIAETLLIATVIPLGIALLAFWVWMLVDCLRREPREGNDRLVWTLVIVFTKVLGAALYYFMRYRPRSGLAADGAGRAG